MCLCAESPELFDVEGASDAFKRSLTKVASGPWVDLWQCAECPQRWRIDVWDKYQVQFAAKIPAEADWIAFDTVPLQKQLLIAARGGLGDQACAWAQCDQRALKGAALCADHLHAMGARR